MPVRLAPVDAPHLIWPVLEAAFERVKQKGRERWSPGFVLSAIQEGRAGLFRVTNDGAHVAWMVFERMDQGGGVWLNVWIAEGEGLEHSKEVVGLIDLLARQVGADSWRCTGRKGWGRALGLKPIATVYERELT